MVLLLEIGAAGCGEEKVRKEAPALFLPFPLLVSSEISGSHELALTLGRNRNVARGSFPFFDDNEVKCEVRFCGGAR